MNYGPNGEPLTTLEWAALMERRAEDLSDDSWWRRRTIIGEDVEVSTVWLGIDYSFGDGPPLIWETMVFGGRCSDWQWRYPTRQTALDDHERIVRTLRAGEDLDDPADDFEAEMQHLRDLADDEPDP